MLLSDIKWCLIVRRSCICVGGFVDLSRTVMGKILWSECRAENVFFGLWSSLFVCDVVGGFGNV